MERRYLGKTDLAVSRLCFGALTIGPLQSNLPLRDGAKVIESALDYGVNFIDTAQYYQTYPYIKEAIKGKANDVVIATKSYAYTAEKMAASLDEALKGIGRDYIDIFLLHEQESIYTIKGHWEALEYLLKAKEQGRVRAVGISTHNVSGVRAALEVPEIEIVHPMVNIQGIGINDGTLEDMLQAILAAHAQGIGIYGMKPLGGGNLIGNVEKALEFVLNLDTLDAIAMGMKSIPEVMMNISLFKKEPVPESLKRAVSTIPRKLHIEEWCQGCGACIKRCSAGALEMVNDKAKVDLSKCRLCGYCGPVCKEFCIKVI
jgi:predicted aldo/keto reductase-like oxidoreductase